MKRYLIGWRSEKKVIRKEGDQKGRRSERKEIRKEGDQKGRGSERKPREMKGEKRRRTKRGTGPGRDTIK
ncbi:hypothetical protein [Methanosarcina sp. 1.H.A.2.2]|uniref:hypothetical protein n=1 Tax=Methanosarcina sp. 1.H.A.2.2 TaxID=1483601 RepID=UPI00138E529C|nr:hypothetical protein [Methanosarcina sp. 1.H.A.2.2]